MVGTLSLRRPGIWLLMVWTLDLIFIAASSHRDRVSGDLFQLVELFKDNPEVSSMYAYYACKRSAALSRNRKSALASWR